MRLAAALAAFFVAAPAATLPVEYDPRFGTGGVARLPYAGTGVGVLLPDGSAAVAVQRAETAGFVSGVIRVTSVGTVDPAFTPIAGAREETAFFNAVFTGLAALPDGRLAALQVQPGSLGLCRSFVSRHLPDGRPDPTFAAQVSVSCSSGLATTAQGELYTAFYRDPRLSLTHTTAVLRIGAAGTPVEPLGMMTAAPSDALPWTYGPVVLTPDLQPIALARPAGGGLGVVRLLGGIPDPFFGAGGLASVRTGEFTYGYDIARAHDGTIVVAAIDTMARQSFFVARFLPDGRPDPAFRGGLVRVPVAAPAEQLVNAMLALQPDGRILLAGSVQQRSAAPDRFDRIALVRLTATGEPDAHFAPGGVASLSLNRGTALGFLAVRPDGRILLGVTGWSLGTSVLPEGAALVQLKGGNDPVARPLRERFAVEYFHAGYGHYFVSADGEEITRLDATPASGWARTGEIFRVWDDGDPSLVPMCRFWSGQTWAPKSSHFYTHDEGECAKVKADPAWIFERNAFAVRRPEGVAGARACPTGSRPLYRAYNRGSSGASNHRYTTDPAILDAMLAQGWVMEGEAATRVFACVPMP